eukprot:275038_1
MTTSCQKLLEHSQFLNNTNETIGVIWLTLDETALFDSKFVHSEFYISLLITIFFAFTISYLIFYTYYPRYDVKQKLLKLKLEYDIEPVLQNDVIPFLNPHLNHHHIIQEILEYAAITLKSENINQYLDSRMTSTYNRDRSNCNSSSLLSLFILSSTLFIMAYFPLYFMIQHGLESYRSYVEIQCIPINDSHNINKFLFDGSGMGQNAEYDEYDIMIFQFNFTPICENINESDYRIYGKFKPISIPDVCYINTNDLTKFRSNDEGCCSTCGDCASRCGRGRCYKCNFMGCEQRCCNCCAFCFCSIFVIVLCIIIILIWLSPAIRYKILFLEDIKDAPLLEMENIDL